MPGKNSFCSQCGAENTPDGKFCAQCGGALRRVEPETPQPAAAHTACPACGAEILPGTRFCAQCGAELGAPKAKVDPSPVTAKPGAALFASLLGLWTWLLLASGLFLYFEYGRDDADLRAWAVALIYVGLLVVLFTGARAVWRQLRRAFNPTAQPSQPTPIQPKEGIRSCVMSVVALLFMLTLVAGLHGYVEDEITSEDIPDDMLPALIYAFVKPTDWIAQGLESVADVGMDVLSLSASGLSCPAYDFPTGGESCFVDSNGMRMCSPGAAGEPSPSQCWVYDDGKNYCQDDNGYIINMTALCDAYPCTPLCKELGIK